MKGSVVVFSSGRFDTEGKIISCDNGFIAVTDQRLEIRRSEVIYNLEHAQIILIMYPLLYRMPTKFGQHYDCEKNGRRPEESF